MNPDDTRPNTDDHYRKERDRWRHEAARVTRQRDELRRELFTTTGALEETRRALDDQRNDQRNTATDRDGWRLQRDLWQHRCIKAREQLEDERKTLKTDGDLLSDLIANACPLWMTQDAARDLAEGAIAELARVGPNVVVLRGTHSEPWTPDDNGNRALDTNYAAPCTVDVTIGTDEWLEYAVFVNPDDNSDDAPICLVDGATTVEDAIALAQHVPGAWVVRRTVTAQQWNTMTLPTPNPAAP